MTDAIAALLEAAERVADTRNDEAIFGLLDRIEHPTGPLWDLIRGLNVTCEFQYLRRQIRKKQNYLRGLEDRMLGGSEYQYDAETDTYFYNAHRSMACQPFSGPSFIQDKIACYERRLRDVEDCGKCRICVRERMFPADDSSFGRLRSRALSDRKLARLLRDEQKRDDLGTLVELLK